MDEISPEDLHKAIGTFLICLGSTLPKELADRISSRMIELSAQIEREGEPSVAKLSKGFAEALVQLHNLPKH